MLDAVGAAVTDHVDGVPKLGLSLRVENFDDGVDFPSPFLGQRCDRTPTRSIVGTEERDLVVHCGDAQDSSDLDRDGQGYHPPADRACRDARGTIFEVLGHDH